MPDLATSLNNQSRTGCRGRAAAEEALTAITDAVSLYRGARRGQPRRLRTRPRHVAEQPSRSGWPRPGPAGGGPDRHHDAVSGPPRSPPPPAAYEPDLATSLNNPAGWLKLLGLREEALIAIDDAVTIRRRLAAAGPTVFINVHAQSLETKAEILAMYGRKAEAQAFLEEANAVRSNG